MDRHRLAPAICAAPCFRKMSSVTGRCPKIFQFVMSSPSTDPAFWAAVRAFFDSLSPLYVPLRDALLADP